jgi:hypothetical protein
MKRFVRSSIGYGSISYFDFADHTPPCVAHGAVDQYFMTLTKRFEDELRKRAMTFSETS